MTRWPCSICGSPFHRTQLSPSWLREFVVLSAVLLSVGFVVLRLLGLAV